MDPTEFWPDLFELSPESCDEFAAFVTEELGIQMTGEKASMLRSRLARRMRDLNLPSFEHYREYLFNPVHIEEERIHFIDAVTTNKTDFFREPTHFDYLVKVVLPHVERNNRGAAHRFHLWCAGCSSGEEPYTQAIVLSEYGKQRFGFDFAILATDISSKVLKHAHAGIYESARVEPVPPELRSRYFRRARDTESDLVRVVPELRSKISFHRLNFMDEDYFVRDKFDAIFFRNVLIYFDKATREVVINKLCRNLKPGGFLFTGHSESLAGLDVPLTLIAPAVYGRAA